MASDSWIREPKSPSWAALCSHYKRSQYWQRRRQLKSASITSSSWWLIPPLVTIKLRQLQRRAVKLACVDIMAAWDAHSSSNWAWRATSCIRRLERAISCLRNSLALYFDSLESPGRQFLPYKREQSCIRRKLQLVHPD